MNLPAKRKGAYLTRVLFVGLALAAVVGADLGIKKYYYSFTYRYYDAGEVYQEDSNTLLLFSPDRYLFWRIKPNIGMKITENPEQYDLRTLGTTRGHYLFTVRTNSDGLNSPEIDLAKPPGTVRIITLGDSRSMAEGIPFDRLYGRRLESMLNEAAGEPRYEVINAGVSGYSSYQGVQQLKRQLLKYEPDYATVLFGINDQDTFQGISDVEKAPIFDSPLTTIRGWLNRSMILYFLSRQVIKAKGALFGKTPIDPTVYESGPDRTRRVSLAEYEGNLREIVDLGKRHGFTPILVIVPTSPYAFYAQLFAPDPPGVDLAEALSASAGDYETAAEILKGILEEHSDFSRARYLLAQCYQKLERFDDAHREFVTMNRGIVFSGYEDVVRKVAAETGAILVDLTPEFSAVTGERLYIDDMHPSEAGQEVIARGIFASIITARTTAEGGAGAP
jgi:lysophospholipase L1-like esterase